MRHRKPNSVSEGHTIGFPLLFCIYSVAYHKFGSIKSRAYQAMNIQLLQQDSYEK